MNCNIFHMVCIKINTTILIVFMILISFQTSGQATKVERMHVANVLFLGVNELMTYYTY